MHMNSEEHWRGVQKRNKQRCATSDMVGLLLTLYKHVRLGDKPRRKVLFTDLISSSELLSFIAPLEDLLKIYESEK